MQLKTSVKIVDDPRGKQAELNQAFRKVGIEVPDLATEQHGSAHGPLEGVDAARAAQTATPQGSNATRMTVMGPASQGVPLATQPLGCRVVIHQPMVVNEIAKGVVIHEGLAPAAVAAEPAATEPAKAAEPISNLLLLNQQLDKARLVVRYLEEQIDKARAIEAPPQIEKEVPPKEEVLKEEPLKEEGRLPTVFDAVPTAASPVPSEAPPVPTEE